MKTKALPRDFSETTFKKLLYKTVHQGPLPIDKIAERIRMSKNYVYRAALPDGGETDSGIPISVEAWNGIMHATGDTSTLRYIAADHGCTLFCLPAGVNGTHELAGQVCDLIAEFGQLVQAAGESLRDGKLTKAEAEHVAREAYDVLPRIVSIVEQFKAAAVKP